MIKICVLLVLSAVARVVPHQDDTNCQPCLLPWQLAYHHDENGNTVAGWKYSLVSAVLSGARVRVVIETSYSTETDNVHVHGDHVFAQLLQHVSKASWDKFQDNAYWWWVIVSTNGVMQMTRYNVGSNTHRGTNSDKRSIKWYVQTSALLPQPSYSHLADGSKVQGNLNDLESSVKNGQDIRCVSDKRYSFPIQNVAINSQGDKFVSGQTLDHISVSTGVNQIQFQSNAYWWFTVVTTKGLRDMSRWTVGKHESRGHTQDTVAIEWFADGCWKEVFFHDSNGAALSGSRLALTSALLLSGHRVRFQIPEWNYYTAEADSLSVRNGHVTAQALKHVSKNGLTGFQDDAYWYWLMVSTTGTVRATRYNVGEHKHRGDSTNKLKVKWFIDTRPWEQVFSNDASGNVLSGSRSNLVQAVRAGADVRCVQGDEVQGYAYKAQNLNFSPDGNHVSAQAVNHVSMQSAPNPNEVMIQPNAYWWFTIVSTTGLREMSRWTVGEHVDRGHTSDKVGQKWFVNH
ncbi:uncharacterized protein LOC144662806 [Oculina patagonica]